MSDASVCTGDIVLSVKGRDAGKYFLVVYKEGNTAYITDGKVRPITALKKKNAKHLKSVKIAVLKDIAYQIKNGEIVGNKRLNRLIKSELKNKQED